MRLVAEGLGCRRGARQLFQRLDFTVESGGALVVTGPNGTGKSSLLRLLAGLARPEAGRIRLEGAREPEAFAEEAHYLGHLDAHKASLSARENLDFWRAMLGRPGLSVSAALEEVGLGGLGSLPVAVLSAGQKRRLALARLLVAHRPLWLLDEPTTALDVEAQARFGEIARAHVAGGGLLIAATHAPLDFPAARLDLGAYRPTRAMVAAEIGSEPE
jgi:heme exporter protein A